MDKTEKIKTIAIFLLSFIGFLTTIKLAMIYYDANFNPYALPSFCSIDDFIDCDGIAKTTESQFFGVPLAYWGMFFYLFVMVLLFADKLKNVIIFRFLEVFKNPMEYISLLGIFSFGVSMLLLGLSLLEIKKLCILCAFTYVLNLLIGLIAIDYKNGGIMKSIKVSIQDFLDAIKNKVYLFALIFVVIIATGALSYTSASNVFAPQVKSQKEFGEFIDAKTNKYAVTGNLLGDKNAKLTIYLYTDYRCPICRPYDIMVHKAAKEIKGFKVEHKNLPLDMECNKNLRSPFHVGSCAMARYAMAAEKQGKLWDMNAKLFELQPNSEDEILEIAKSLGLDTAKLEQDANSKETNAQLIRDIAAAYEKRINATPTLVINDKVYVGMKSYPELKKLIEDEIKKSKK